jgi:hypothetical protein
VDCGGGDGMRERNRGGRFIGERDARGGKQDRGLAPRKWR